jgi:hypothetical protein
MSEVKTFIASKIVNGKPMTYFEFLSKVRNQEAPKDQQDQEGYLVIYPPDGYQSWSPKKVFDDTHREITAAEKEIII